MVIGQLKRKNNNAAALQLLGIPVIKNKKGKHATTLKHWIEESFTTISFPDETQQVVDSIFNDFKLAKRLARLRSDKSLLKRLPDSRVGDQKIFSQLK